MLQHVRLDLGGLDVLVPQQFLHGPDVVAVLQQMGCKGVTKHVSGGALKHLTDERRSVAEAFMTSGPQGTPRTGCQGYHKSEAGALKIIAFESRTRALQILFPLLECCRMPSVIGNAGWIPLNAVLFAERRLGRIVGYPETEPLPGRRGAPFRLGR